MPVNNLAQMSHERLVGCVRLPPTDVQQTTSRVVYLRRSHLQLPPPPTPPPEHHLRPHHQRQQPATNGRPHAQSRVTFDRRRRCLLPTRPVSSGASLPFCAQTGGSRIKFPRRTTTASIAALGCIPG